MYILLYFRYIYAVIRYISGLYEAYIINNICNEFHDYYYILLIGYPDS